MVMIIALYTHTLMYFILLCRFDHACEVTKTGEIFAIGGDFLNAQTEIFDMATLNWRRGTVLKMYLIIKFPQGPNVFLLLHDAANTQLLVILLFQDQDYHTTSLTRPLCHTRTHSS